MKKNNPTSLNISENTLAGINLFNDLKTSQRKEIVDICRGMTVPSKSVVVDQFDLSKEVYFIVSGTVRVTYYSKFDKEVSFREQYPGEMFGELSAIDGEARSAHIRALTDVSLVVIQAEDFINLLDKYPTLSLKVMQHLSLLIRSLSERVIEFSALQVNRRVHNELIRISKRSESKGKRIIISPSPTHIELANRVSTHREAVTRELNSLEDRNILERNNQYWEIPDIMVLERMVEAE